MSAFVPVLITLPLSPVLLHLPVRHLLMLRAVTVAGWNCKDPTGHLINYDRVPRSIIMGRAEPVPPVRSIPVTLIKENILVNFGRVINISVRDHDQSGRTGHNQGRQSDLNAYIGRLGERRGNERKHYKRAQWDYRCQNNVSHFFVLPVVPEVRMGS